MDFEKIGRARVMVRLPRYRKQLSDLDFLALSSLLEAYGVAVTSFESLQDHEKSEHALVAEYARQCQAIEEKIAMLLNSRSSRIIR